MTLDAPPQPVSTMRRDIVSAYVASGMKIASWLIASAIVFRYDIRFFAIFTLIRSTLSLLNYTTLGLAPAIIHRLSIVTAEAARRANIVIGQDVSLGNSVVLGYADPDLGTAREDPRFEIKRLVYSALLLAVLIGAFGWGITCMLAALEWVGDSSLLWMHYTVLDIVLAIGAGLALRLASDACGAILQAFGHIAADNWCVGIADALWIGLMLVLLSIGWTSAETIARSFFYGSLGLLGIRISVMFSLIGAWRPRRLFFHRLTVLRLLGFGVMVSLAQLADFLYAPTDYWIIRTQLSLDDITTYAPAVQIDAALLILVAGLAGVILPKSARAAAGGDVATLRRYYLRGTVASFALLTAAAVTTWLASPWIFRLWLGDAMPATQAILPLVLIHTVVGGSGAVGRSVLLGMGKVRPYTAVVLIAGLANVALSFCFVRLGWGLNGIILGTIVAVVARCAIWQPWYVWRALRRS